MKGRADKQRKQQLLLGGSRPKGGWWVEEGEGGSSRLWFSSATSPDWSPQTSITATDRHRQTSEPCSFSWSCQWIREGFGAHLWQYTAELHQEKDWIPGTLYFRGAVHNLFQCFWKKSCIVEKPTGESTIHMNWWMNIVVLVIFLSCCKYKEVDSATFNQERLFFSLFDLILMYETLNIQSSVAWQR